MPYYELIFETGSKSVAFYENDDEMQLAVKAQHTRAKLGEDGGPEGTRHPAERVVEVQKYNEHPNDLNTEQTLSADVLSKEVGEIVKRHTEAGVVSIPEVVQELREVPSPVVVEAGRHESMFKMEAEEVIKKGWDD